MKSLFIIGNGFDLDHKIDSSYESFRRYLKIRYPDANEDELIMPEVTMGHHGEEIYNDDEVVSFLLRIISEAEGYEWKDVEKSIGLLDFSECFDYSFYELDEDGDIDSWKQTYTNEDIASNLLLPVSNITKYFSDWIDTIQINASVLPKKDFKRLINPDEDLFLTFNYTDTLEKIYNTKMVCHIHGKQGGEILFGHGNVEDYYEKNMDRYIGAENVLDEIQNNLRKDTVGAFQQHLDFFNKIKGEVDKVFTYGFSFSEVDRIYIREICKRLPDNAVWYLNDYDDSNKREQFASILRSFGFLGEIADYHIQN